MPTFQELIQKINEKHAYTLGAEAFKSAMDRSALPPKKLRSPFDIGSKAEEEWLDGYMDAFFVHYGVNINEA